MGTIGIIGAGVSGLVAFRALRASGHGVVMFEKSRSFSGRCSTRSWNGHIVDHGAQYFTAVTDSFRRELECLPSDELKRIGAEVLNDLGEAIPATGGSRYYFRQGNNRMGEVLSTDLDIRFQCPVTDADLEAVGNGWKVADESFDAVLVTAPWPQTASILGKPTEEGAYVPCLTACFEFEGEWIGTARERYALSLRDPEEPLAWSACENHKEGRVTGNKTVFVVQASEAFSLKWLKAAPQDYMAELLDRLKLHWKIPEAPSASFNHRWRYARRIHKVKFTGLPQGVFLAGDSRVESKIEQVWLDGKRAAAEVERYLNTL